MLLPLPLPFYLFIRTDRKERKGPSAGMAAKYEGWKKRYRDGNHKSLFDEILILLASFYSE
jgi:hypothetical protein